MDRRLRIPCAENLLAECAEPRLDSHHIYAKRTAQTRLERDFGDLACNKIISCRCIHERVLDHIPPPEYPAREIMKQMIAEERRRRE